MDYTVNLLLENHQYSNYSDINLDRLLNNSFVADNISLKLIKEGKNSGGVCYNYALKNYNLEYLEDSLEYLKDNYIKIDLEQLQKGDIIIFYWGDMGGTINEGLSEYNIEHLGIVVKPDTDINKIIIRSKWGQDGIFETNVKTLPDIYGDRVCFFRRKNKF